MFQSAEISFGRRTALTKTVMNYWLMCGVPTHAGCAEKKKVKAQISLWSKMYVETREKSESASISDLRQLRSDNCNDDGLFGFNLQSHIYSL